VNVFNPDQALVGECVAIRRPFTRAHAEHFVHAKIEISVTSDPPIGIYPHFERGVEIKKFVPIRVHICRPKCYRSPVSEAATTGRQRFPALPIHKTDFELDPDRQGMVKQGVLRHSEARRP
jgi:hypothetical protein